MASGTGVLPGEIRPSYSKATLARQRYGAAFRERVAAATGDRPWKPGARTVALGEPGRFSRRGKRTPRAPVGLAAAYPPGRILLREGPARLRLLGRLSFPWGHFFEEGGASGSRRLSETRMGNMEYSGGG